MAPAQRVEVTSAAVDNPGVKPTQRSQVRPVQYRGKLAAADIAAGMNAAIRNARRLLTDAEMLQANGRFPSAAALAILSIEESGKLTILRSMAIAPDDDAVQKSWKALRTHTAKNPHWIVRDLVASGARHLLDFRLAVEGGDHADMLDAVKQIAFYSDCFGAEPHWSEPTEVIDDAFSASLIEQAQFVLPASEVSARAIELWIQHIGPHYAKPEMGAAVVAWCAVMKAEGLSDIDPEAMARFMGKLASIDDRN
jgi:AbiV family abortive infection protein